MVAAWLAISLSPSIAPLSILSSCCLPWICCDMRDTLRLSLHVVVVGSYQSLPPPTQSTNPTQSELTFDVSRGITTNIPNVVNFLLTHSQYESLKTSCDVFEGSSASPLAVLADTQCINDMYVGGQNLGWQQPIFNTAGSNYADVTITFSAQTVRHEWNHSTLI